MKKLHFWVVIILLVAFILRFYQIPEYIQFLGDQGRDVLIVKRMIVDHKWTLLGPSASVGGFFTGAIYYYLIMPFLWIFRLDPAGPAYFSAFVGCLTVLMSYLFALRFFGFRAAFVAASLVAISPKMVDISRFSWNPNPVPLFALLTTWFLYLGVTKQKKLFTLISGICLGTMFQLHYINLVFIPIVVLVLFLTARGKNLLTHLFAIMVGFAVGDAMFLLFELRHGFPNIKSVWEFIFRRGQTVAPRDYNFFWLIIEILRRLFGMTLNIRDLFLEYIFLLPALLGFGYWAIRNNLNRENRVKIILLASWVFVGALGMGLYKGQLHDHYFSYLFPLPFLLVGGLFEIISRNKVGLVVGIAGYGILVAYSYMGLYFHEPPHNMLAQIQQIDKIILEESGGATV